MRTQLVGLKDMEKALRQQHDLLIKGTAAAEGKRKDMDERFILNEIQALYKNESSIRALSREILKEEADLEKKIDREWEALKGAVVEFEAGAQAREKRIWEL